MDRIQVLICIFSTCFLLILSVMLCVYFHTKFKSVAAPVMAFLQSERYAMSDERADTAVDYDYYKMSVKERLLCIAAAGVIIFLVVYIFYRSIAAAICILPFAMLYPGIKKTQIIKKRKEELNFQFREALYSISSSLSAGKSIETAFVDAQKELRIQYPDSGTYILDEIDRINRKVEMNDTIEQALADFAARSHLEDVGNFAEVFFICKRAGGNLVQVVRNTAEIISEKIDVRQEINTLLAEKRLEHKILNLMPVFMVLLLSTSAEEFMAPVFEEVLGRAAMTFALMLFAIAYYISKRIMDIEV